MPDEDNCSTWLAAAFELKDTLGKANKIVLVSDPDNFEFTPSNPWVPCKWTPGTCWKGRQVDIACIAHDFDNRHFREGSLSCLQDNRLSGTAD